MDLNSLQYVIVDLETTTNYKNEPEIIEIGGIHINNSKIDYPNSFHSLINPKCKIKYIDKKITGIKDEDLIYAKTIDKIFPKFIDFINDRILIAHNAKFDIRILKKTSENINYTFEEPLYIDTLALSRKLLNLDSYKLKDIRKIYSWGNIHHRALTDCEATGKLFLVLLDKLKDKKITTYNQMDLFLKGKDYKQKTLF